MGEHGVETDLGATSPGADEVLGVVGEILTNDGDVWVGEDLAQPVDKFDFLVEGVVVVAAFVHERDADGVVFAPGETYASDVAGDSLDVADKG